MHILFKLIFRSWRRNKSFAIISILSLAIGIACTNLLTAFVIYESNIETSNPNRDRIWYMTQDSPMQSGETVSYISGAIAQQIKDTYPVVEDYLRLSTESMNYVGIDEKRFPSIICITADPSFPKFFPYEVLYGDLNRALTEPGKIALTEQTAKIFFENENALGKIISFVPDSDYGFYADEVPKVTTYEIVAVLKDRVQSFLRFDGIISNSGNFHGGITFVLADKSVTTDKFAEQLKKDGILTMQQNIGRYYFASLQDSYFGNYPDKHHLGYINGQQKSLLYVGLIAAFLILLISCFNYINLNFSRLFQHIRTMRTQRLMGAEDNQIILQLFGDTFLTVFIGFLLSLLIAYDLLPFFNNIVSGRMPPSFFFNLQVLPYLCLFILTLSIVPALYIGRKVSKQTQQDYKTFFTGNNRQRIIAILTTAQFIISIALIIGTITANKQVGLISKGGESYKGLIEIGGYTNNSYMRPMVNDLKTRLKMEEVVVSGTSILFSNISQVIIKDEEGNDTYNSLLQFVGNTGFFETLGVNILKGLSLKEATEKYHRPVYINESFAHVLVPKDENPVGMPLNAYTTSYGRPSDEITIVGIVENFFTNSLEIEIFPAIIQLDNEDSNLYYIYLRLDSKHPEMLKTVQSIWEKYNPNREFPYHNVWEGFKMRNKRIYEMSHLLIMFSLISIFLTCFGLFGMALYATEQRTKEIGIRKVNGATIPQIMLLLNKQFILWIAIAFLIATPVTWILLNRWLENFAYRVDVTPGICLLAVLVVLIVTIITVSWHSYKAAKANPVDSLKDE